MTEKSLLRRSERFTFAKSRKPALPRQSVSPRRISAVARLQLIQPESVIRIRERLFRAYETRDARRIFEVYRTYGS